MRIKFISIALALLAALGVGTGIYFSGNGISGQSSGATPEETAAITASNGLVHRDHDALILSLEGGEALALADHQTCGDIPCPARLGGKALYKGWDEALGGYRLSLDGKDMILPFGPEAMLQEADHADPPTNGPMTLPAPPPPKAAADDSVTQWLSEIAQGRDNDEAKAIDASKGKAERKGSDLILTLDGGKHLILSDRLACGQAACPAPLFRAYAYAGLSPDGHAYLVEERPAEENLTCRVSLSDGAISDKP